LPSTRLQGGELLLDDIEEEDETEEGREARMIAVSSRNPYTPNSYMYICMYIYIYM
jgi:hypothetical protein